MPANFSPRLGYTSPYAYSGYLPAMPQTTTQLPQSLAELRPSSKRKGGGGGGGGGQGVEPAGYTQLKQPEEVDKMESLTVRKDSIHTLLFQLLVIRTIS
jgi:hypothetical protein